MTDLENRAHLDARPKPLGSKASILLLRWTVGAAAPVRAVVIVEG